MYNKFLTIDLLYIAKNDNNERIKELGIIAEGHKNFCLEYICKEKESEVEILDLNNFPDFDKSKIDRRDEDRREDRGFKYKNYKNTDTNCLI